MATRKEQRKKREKLFTAQKVYLYIERVSGYVFAFQIAKQEKNLVRFPVKDLQQVVELRRSE